MATDLDSSGLNRAGRRAAEKRAKRMRTAGAVLAAGAASFGTTAAVVGISATTAGAAELTVTTLDPDGAGSLHDVAEAANNGDVITFQAGLTGTIFLEDQIDIDTGIAILGPGADVITVSGDTDDNGSKNVRIFDIDGAGSDATSVTISGLTLTDGTDTVDGDGGGAIILREANLVLENVVISDSETTGDGGGAIMVPYDSGNSDGIELVIESSTITGNTSESWGGGLYFYSELGSVLIANSTFSQNEALDGGGGGAWIGGFENQTTITGSTFTGNDADDQGGGLASRYAAPLTITGSTFTDNEAFYGGGGGLYVESAQGTVTIESSVISGNRAIGEESDYMGGGIYFTYHLGDVNIHNTTISDNTSGGGGGGVSFWDGGAGAVHILNSTISGNRTLDDWGGGLYIGYHAGPVSIFNSTISGNVADEEGGGIQLWNENGLTLTHVTLTNNTATTFGGIYMPALEATVSQEKRVGKPTEQAAAPNQHHGGDGGGRGARSQDSSSYVVDVNATGTIIAGNTGTDVGGGQVTSFFSLIGTLGDDTSLVDTGGTVLGQNPGLAALANNGGPTQTHALLPQSLAINSGENPVAAFPGNEYDQRGSGFVRVSGGRVDIGAYEVQVPVVNFTG